LTPTKQSTQGKLFALGEPEYRPICSDYLTVDTLGGDTVTVPRKALRKGNE
jgi:hypothetical protein